MALAKATLRVGLALVPALLCFALDLGAARPEDVGWHLSCLLMLGVGMGFGGYFAARVFSRRRFLIATFALALGYTVAGGVILLITSAGGQSDSGPLEGVLNLTPFAIGAGVIGIVATTGRGLGPPRGGSGPGLGG